MTPLDKVLSDLTTHLTLVRALPDQWRARGVEAFDMAADDLEFALGPILRDGGEAFL